MHTGTHTTYFKRRDSFSECRQTPLLPASASSCSWWCPCIHHTQLSSPVCVSCKSTVVCRNRVCMYIWRPPEEPLVLVVGLSSLAQGDSALVASTILLGPDRLRSQSTANLHLQVHPSAVVRRCCRCVRQTVQLHRCAAFRYLLVEPSVTQNIQALASLFSVRATQVYRAPSHRQIQCHRGILYRIKAHLH